MTQDFIFFLLNGHPVRVRGDQAFGSLAEYLRREAGLTGTKIACAQGACGACTVLVGRPGEKGLEYLAVNSCLQRVFQVHGCHIVTVEGVNGPPKRDPELNPIQQAMWENHAAQCGFCTPGFVMSLTACGEAEEPALTQESACTKLCGNLCRCTGYDAIFQAVTSIEWANHRRLEEIYPSEPLVEQIGVGAGSAEIRSGGHLALVTGSLTEALEWRAAHPGSTPIAGGTEFGTVEAAPSRRLHWLSLSRLEELKAIAVEDGSLVIGAGANWTSVQAAVAEALPEFHEYLDRWGSPQLRAAGTVGGSILNASYISDVLPLLLVCEAQLEVHGSEGTRFVPVEGRTTLLPGELLIRVHVPLPSWNGAQIGFRKISRRNGFDRAVVNAAFWWKDGEFRIAFGGAGKSVRRLTKTEEFLSEADLDDPEVWKAAVRVAADEIDPPSDSSAGAGYRRQLILNLLQQWGRQSFAEVKA